MEKLNLLNGNNIELLKTLEENSVDSIITDPPYGLSFMGKKWDYDVPSTDFWKEVLRVLKPGGHVLSFGGTRTYHRMVVNMEDAGFEIRDQIMWLYGSGFPKSHNIGKAVDKIQGNEREVVGYVPQFPDGTRGATYRGQANNDNTTNFLVSKDTTTNGLKPIYKKNNEYEGWGTALKPANEPICLARKPLEESTIAKNVIKWGTGGINVDGCRIGNDIIESPQHNTSEFKNVRTSGNYENTYNGVINKHEGRFPANIILECICDEVIKGKKGEKIPNYTNGGNKEGRVFGNGKGLGEHNSNIYVNEIGDIHTNPDCPCRILDEQSGINKSVGPLEYDYSDAPNQNNQTKLIKNIKSGVHYSDKGGASRFFYVPKVSKKERNLGLDDFEEKEMPHGVQDKCGKCNKQFLAPNNSQCVCEEPERLNNKKKNIHPTVKPINLLTYLVRLITPQNGIVMDCYMGSGSTGIAALLEGFQFIGMEMDEEYFNIAEARIDSWEQYKDLIKTK